MLLRLSASLGVEVGCLDCIALGRDVGIPLGDAPVEVACVTFSDICLDVGVG